MAQASRSPMGWGVFARRVAAISVWLFASQALGVVAASADLPMAVRAGAACLATIPVVIWLAASKRRLADPDPAGGLSIAASMVAGALWAILFAPGIVALMAVATALDPPQSAYADPLLGMAFVMLCCLAPSAALMGQLSAQHLRWRAARTPPRP